MIELRKAGIELQSQTPVEVRYEGEIVGEYVSDIVVEDKVIVELKSVRKLTLAHEIQLVNYLVATGKSVGLLLNFGESKVEVKRKVRALGESQQENQSIDHQSSSSCYPVKRVQIERFCTRRGT